MAKCRSCGAEIVWVLMKSGNSMPCDPALVPFWAKFHGKGKVVTQEGDVVSCEFEGPLDDMTNVGYIPHWATCPFSRAHKRKK